MSGHHSFGPRKFSDKGTIRVLITGAAGQIAYSLAFMIAQGKMFGDDRRVAINLLDLPQCVDKMEALSMEIDDLASPLVEEIVCTTDYAVAFKDIDVALLVGARPRGPGMERKDLLEANAAIFKGQGEALDKYAKKTVKVLVVGNPANTNALITATHAPSIPKQNFTALTRLDHNRAVNAIAKRIGANPADVKNVIIWGNHSATQFPDVRFGTREGYPRPQDSAALTKCVDNDEWLQGEFITTIQQRGKAIIDKRQASSAGSAAAAICDHMRDWELGSNGDMVSMAVWTDGKAYGIDEGLIFSFPCVCKNGTYEIVDDLTLDEFASKKFEITKNELLEERKMALGK